MDIKHAGIMLVIALCVGFVSGIVFEKWQGTVTGATVTQQKGSLEDMQQRLKVHNVDVPPNAFIAEITDIKIVQQQQPQLYKDARNGDYIVAFGDTVIVYDYGNDNVVTNVQIKQ